MPHGIGREANGQPVPAGYAGLGLDDLCLYAVSSVLENGEVCTFERLVAECYTLFPDKFSLQGYPQWPDSARVNKSWLRCRSDKGWIAGSVREGFHLTEAGLARLRAMASRVRSAGATKRPSTTRPRSPEDAIVRSAEASRLFQRYVQDPDGFSLTDMELRELLQCTMEAPRRVLRETLQRYLYAAQVMGQSDLEAFLRACERRLRRESPR